LLKVATSRPDTVWLTPCTPAHPSTKVLAAWKFGGDDRPRRLGASSRIIQSILHAGRLVVLIIQATGVFLVAGVNSTERPLRMTSAVSLTC